MELKKIEIDKILFITFFSLIDAASDYNKD